MLFQILWRLFTAQLFKSHRFFMPAFMLHKCTHALNYLLLKFVYKKTLFTYNNGLKMGVSLFSFNFVFMWYFSNLHSKHLFINTYCVETKVHKANSFLIINFKWYILHVFLSMGNLKKGQCAVIYFETFSPPGYFFGVTVYYPNSTAQLLLLDFLSLFLLDSVV